MNRNHSARALARARHRQRVLPDRRDRSLNEEARRERLKAMQRELV